MGERHEHTGTGTQHLASTRRVFRRGRVNWLTHPPGGVARVGVARPAELSDLEVVPVSLHADQPGSEDVSPGELLAVAYGMFVAAAAAQGLVGAGAPADELVVEATCVFTHDLPDRELIALDLDVRARVRDIDETTFRRIAESARVTALGSAGARIDLPGELRAALESVAR